VIDVKMSKLTVQSVKALDPPSEGQTFLWDTELRGFGVRVIPSGLKTFVLQYRNGEGRSRRLILGRFGVVTVEQARNKAKIKLGAIANGEDPAESGPRETITVAEVCEWYLAEAETGRILGRRNRPIKSSTLAMDRCRIETHIKPLIGQRQIRALKLADIAGMQADIASGKTAKPRGKGRGGATTGGTGVAARTVSTLQSLLAHAKLLNVIGTNPAVGVRKLSGNRKERRLSVAEIRRLGEAMRRAERGGERPVALAIVRLLILTGFRISEAQGLQRHWLHSDGGFVHFPDTKSDGQVRVIGPSALKLVASQPVRENSPYVFPADAGEGDYTAAKGCLARLCAAANIADVTPHTLRHTFGSVAGDLCFSELTIAALLGHAARGVTQGYVHIDEALKLAAFRTCEEIAGLLSRAEVADELAA
jgi:integrase